MTVKQRYRGIGGDGKGRTISYIVSETATEQTALQEVESVAPLTYATFPRENMRVTEVKKSSVDGTGFPDLSKSDGVYYVDVMYARNSTTRGEAVTNKNPYTTEDIDSVSFQVALEDEHFTFPPLGKTSLQQRQTGTKPGDDAAGAKFAPVEREGLNWQGREKGYEGVSLPMPRGAFQLTFYPSTSKVNPSVERECTDLVGKVNGTAFWGFNPGEVLCVSCAGQGRTTADWEITFEFRIQRNKAKLDLGNDCVLTNVQGWDYVDVEYITAEKKLDDDNKVVTKALRQASVYQVYERVSFDDTLRKLY